MGSSSEPGVLRAFRDGIGRVNGAPVLVLGCAAMTLLVALPLSIALGGMIEAHLGSSAESELAAERANADWWEEFTAQASGLGTTFTPSIIGFAAVLENTGGLLDNRPLAATIGGATAAWLVLWSFLTGGVIDRYARGRPTRTAGFFAACGTHFWRFLRLGIVIWTVYLGLFGPIHGWVLQDGYALLTRDLTAERSAFAVRVGGYTLFAALLAVCSLLFDYSRVRLVVEDRRSAIGALLASMRFLARHPGAVGRLFLLNGAALAALVAGYAALAPGAPGSGWRLLVALGIGQAYIVGRHYVKLLVYASETALFQGALAHADYTAFPLLIWPDSPAVETLTNAEPDHTGGVRSGVSASAEPPAHSSMVHGEIQDLPPRGGGGLR